MQHHNKCHVCIFVQVDGIEAISCWTLGAPFRALLCSTSWGVQDQVRGAVTACSLSFLQDLCCTASTRIRAQFPKTLNTLPNATVIALDP